MPGLRPRAPPPTAIAAAATAPAMAAAAPNPPQLEEATPMSRMQAPLLELDLLTHGDLSRTDDDDLRHNKPTCRVQICGGPWARSRP